MSRPIWRGWMRPWCAGMSHLLRLPKFCGICERRLRLELRGRAGARTAYLTCTCWFRRQKTLPRPARLVWLEQEARKRAWRVDAAPRRLAALRRRNVGLVSTRNKLSHGPWAHVYATTEIVESAAIDQYDIDALFPLYVYPQPTQQERQDGQMDLEFPTGSGAA